MHDACSNRDGSNIGYRGELPAQADCITDADRIRRSPLRASDGGLTSVVAVHLLGVPIDIVGDRLFAGSFEVFRLDDDVFHTYSVYACGNESLTEAYRLLDTMPYGRQQDFEDSPPGWPQKPTYGVE